MGERLPHNQKVFGLITFFATSPTRLLISAHTPTMGVAKIFSLTPMPQLGIKLTLALLHLFEGP